MDVIIKSAAADAEELCHRPKGTHVELILHAPDSPLSPLQQLLDRNAAL